MANSCDQVQSIRKGDGVTTQFSFTFTYDKQSEVIVSLWDETIEYYTPLSTDDWSFANATTIEFTTPPPYIEDSNGDQISNVKISRVTDLDALVASFYPGSAIRAQDLNNNFEQLRNAIQEGRCSIPDGVIVLLEDYWARGADTITSAKTWVSSDDKVATTAAIDIQIAAVDSFPEAPQDSNLYGRENASWKKVPSPGISDAPVDNKEYVRLNAAWKEIAADQVGVPEAPINGLTYGRRQAAWVEINASSGGINYRGLRDVTLAAPSSPQNGDFYVNSATTGFADSSWNGIAGDPVTGGERLVYDGTKWELLPNPPADTGVQSVVAGNDITVNASNPANPIVSVTPNSFLKEITAGLNITVNGSEVGVTPASFIPYDISTLISLP